MKRLLPLLIACLSVISASAQITAVKVNAVTGELVTPTASNFITANDLLTGTNAYALTIPELSLPFSTNTTLSAVLGNIADWTTNNFALASTVTNKANLASPTFTGTPAAPTASAGTNTTQLATTAFVTTAVAPKAPLASPTFTGTPAAPTASAGTATTQLATTAFVGSAVTNERTATRTLTGATISGSANTLTNIPLGSAITGTLQISNGGTGTTTPGLVAGTNVTITGTWPNQTINASGGSGSAIALGSAIAFLTQAGNNTTGALGDPAHPYATGQAALDAGASVLVAMPRSSGDYGVLNLPRTVTLIGYGGLSRFADIGLNGHDLIGNGQNLVSVGSIAAAGSGTISSLKATYINAIGGTNETPGGSGGDGAAVRVSYCQIINDIYLYGGNGGPGTVASTAATISLTASGAGGTLTLNGDSQSVIFDGDVYTWPDFSGWMRTGSTGTSETYTYGSDGPGQTFSVADAVGGSLNVSSFIDGTGVSGGGNGGNGGTITLDHTEVLGTISLAPGLGTDGGSDGAAGTYTARWSTFATPVNGSASNCISNIVDGYFADALGL